VSTGNVENVGSNGVGESDAQHKRLNECAHTLKCFVKILVWFSKTFQLFGKQLKLSVFPLKWMDKTRCFMIKKTKLG
jgi:hypothetical protein